jgi:hypothetical protein
VVSSVPFETPLGKRKRSSGKIESRSKSESKVKSKGKKYSASRRLEESEDTEATEVWEDPGSESSSDLSSPCPRSRKHMRFSRLTGFEAQDRSVRFPQWNRSAREEFLSPNAAYQHVDKDGRLARPYKADPHESFSKHTKDVVAFRVWDNAPAVISDDDDGRLDGVANPRQYGTFGTNSVQGFLAGAILGDDMPPPNRNDQNGFGATTFAHLRREKVPSPWISIWYSLISAVHRLLRSATAHLSIIDVESLVRGNRHKYPNVCPAASIIAQYRMREIRYSQDNKPFKYKGTPELLVWQVIPKKSIIACRSHQDFKEYCRLNPAITKILCLEKLGQAEMVVSYRPMERNGQVSLAPLDMTTGEAVGAILAFAGIPEQLLEGICRTVAKNWHFRSRSSRTERALDFDIYRSGVRAGYHRHGTPLQRSLSTMNAASSALDYELVNLHEQDGKSLDTNENNDGIMLMFSRSLEDIPKKTSENKQHKPKLPVRKSLFATDRRGSMSQDVFLRRRKQIERTISTLSPRALFSSKSIVPIPNLVTGATTVVIDSDTDGEDLSSHVDLTKELTMKVQSIASEHRVEALDDRPVLATTLRFDDENYIKDTVEHQEEGRPTIFDLYGQVPITRPVRSNLASRFSCLRPAIAKK